MTYQEQIGALSAELAQISTLTANMAMAHTGTTNNPSFRNLLVRQKHLIDQMSVLNMRELASLGINPAHGTSESDNVLCKTPDLFVVQLCSMAAGGPTDTEDQEELVKLAQEFATQPGATTRDFYQALKDRKQSKFSDFVDGIADLYGFERGNG